MKTDPTGQAALQASQQTMHTCDWKSIAKSMWIPCLECPSCQYSERNLVWHWPFFTLTKGYNVSMWLRFSWLDNHWLYKDIVHISPYFYTWWNVSELSGRERSPDYYYHTLYSLTGTFILGCEKLDNFLREIYAFWGEGHKCLATRR